MDNSGITKWVVMSEGMTVYETYSQSALLEYIEDAKKREIKLEIHQEIIRNEDTNLPKVKAIKGKMWVSARQKYGCDDVFMIGEELYYIVKRHSNYYVGKKILSDLTLSAENFKIML